MKYLLLTSLIALNSALAFAQCTPDESLIDNPFGIYSNSSTSCQFNFVSFTDTVITNIPIVGTVTLHIDAFRLVSIDGLPSGLAISTNEMAGATIESPYGIWLNTGGLPNQSNVVGCIDVLEGSTTLSSLANGGPNNDGIYPLTFIIDARIGATVPDASIIVPNGNWLSTVDPAVGGGGLAEFSASLNVNGCCLTTSSTTTASSCNSYTWNSNTYTQSGTYTSQTTNSEGCDSIATLNLTITPNAEEYLNYTLCDGEPITINGTTYTQTGQYNQLLPGSTGCDTLLTIYVQAESSPGIDILGNTTISPNSGEDYAFVNPGGYSITWAAVNGTVISGQGTSLVTIFWDATGGGIVTVTLSNNNCSYTYTLAVGSFVGIEDQASKELNVYPNPSTGIYQVQGTGTITVHNALGDLILRKNISGNATIDLSNQANGIYTLQLQSEKGTFTSKLIKR